MKHTSGPDASRNLLILIFYKNPIVFALICIWKDPGSYRQGDM